MSKHKTFVAINIPRWAASLYVILALILLPWTIYLGVSLPAHHLSEHWDTSWTGLDVGIIATMLVTALFAYRKSMWVIVSSTAVGSLLIVDAWFDVMSERQPADFRQALALAILIEIPLACMSFWLAGHTLQRKK